jgi:hypothetical protein
MALQHGRGWAVGSGRTAHGPLTLDRGRPPTEGDVMDQVDRNDGRRWTIRGQELGLWPKVVGGPSFEDEEEIEVVEVSPAIPKGAASDDALEVLRAVAEDPSEDDDWECVRASDLEHIRAFLADYLSGDRSRRDEL